VVSQFLKGSPVKLSAHLRRSRHGVFYFRCIIPKVLRPLYGGKTEIKYSLRTRDPVSARRDAYILSAETAHIFHKAKQTMSRYDPRAFNPNDPSTWPSAREDSRRWVFTLPSGLRIKTDPNNPSDQANALEAIERIGQLPNLVAASVPVAPPAPKKQSIKLSEGVELYLTQRAKDSAVPKTIIDMRGTLNRFLAWTSDPHDPPVDEIEKKLIVKYKRHLLSAAENTRGKTGLSKKTIEKHFIFLHGFFQYLFANEYLAKDHEHPTAGLTLYAKREKRRLVKSAAYQPFERKELGRIFDPNYIKAVKKPHEFWLPLLGLYTGARINELSQLWQDDIREIEGVWCIDIHGRRGNKLKNDSSERKVPLHDDLIRLGLLDYMADAADVAPDERLFPYLHEGLNGFGDVPSEAFGRYLDKLKIVDAKKVFHSFRSTLNQTLQDALLSLA